MVRTLDNLIDTVTASTSLPRDTVMKILHATFNTIGDALCSENKVTIAGFGSLDVRMKPVSRATDHHTEREYVKVAAFAASKDLREAVNKDAVTK
jgi:nucleoid DNA-binding protein